MVLNVLYKISDFLDKICCAIIGSALALMVIVTTSQVIFRALFSALTWSEELDRYLLVWISFLAAAAVFKRGSHVAITMLPDKLPPVAGKVLRVISNLICLVLFLICFRYGIVYMGLQASQVSPALHVPMKYIYLSIPVGFGMMILYSIINLIELFIPKKGGKD